MQATNAMKATRKFLFQSLQGRILIAGVFLAVIPATIVGVMAIQKASLELNSQLNAKLEAAAAQTATTTQADMENYLGSVESTAGAIGILSTAANIDQTKIASVLRYATNTTSNMQAMTLLSTLGVPIVSTEDNAPSVGNEEYFRTALSGVSVVSDPVLTPTGDEVVYMTAPANYNGATVGVLRATFSLKSYYQTHLTAFNSGLGGGYPYVVDKNGVLIGHPKAEKLTKENLTQDASPELAAAALAMTHGETGMARYAYEGVNEVVAYQPVGLNGWSIAVTEPSSKALGAINGFRQIMIMTLIIIAVIAALAAVWVAHSISDPIRFLGRLASDFAVGGLGEDLDAETKEKIARRNDEIGVLGRSFREMETGLAGMANVATRVADANLSVEVQPRSDRDVLGKAIAKAVRSLNELFSQLNETAQSLASAKDQLAQSADQAAQATQQVAQTASEVAQSTGQQAAATQEVSQALEQLSGAIEMVVEDAAVQTRQVQAASALSEKVSACGDTVSDAAQKALERSRQAGKTSQEGAEMVQKAIDGMERIKVAVEGASGEISHLGERSTEIGKIVAVIDDIAAQTNLLALNAAIEAARAGEQGRGFAVVADEVRKLAERVGVATKEIADLISGIQQGVEGTVKAMGQGSAETGEGAKLAAEAGESLRQILTVVEEMNSEIVDIATSSEELKKAGAEMSGTMEQTQKLVEKSLSASEEIRGNAAQVIEGVSGIAAIAEQNSAATEEVSASAQEMSAQVEEVTAATHSLGEMAEDLRKRVVVFKLRNVRLTDVSGRHPESEEDSHSERPAA